MGHDGGMKPVRWPRKPSATFEAWDEEQLAWRKAHRATRGHRLVVNSAEMHKLYRALEGPDELEGLGGLARIRGVLERICGFQQIVWDADAAEVIKAAAEGTLDEAGLALGLDAAWILKAAKTVQPVKRSSEAMPWIRAATQGCPANPLIRSIELHALWSVVAGARTIGENLRDALLAELEDDQVSVADMARALEWSPGRVKRRLALLEEVRVTQEARAAEGQVAGIVPLRRPA